MDLEWVQSLESRRHCCTPAMSALQDIKTRKILCFETVSVRTLGELHNNETLIVLVTPFFSHHPGKGLGAFIDVGRKVCSSGLESIPWGPFTCIFFFFLLHR